MDNDRSEKVTIPSIIGGPCLPFAATDIIAPESKTAASNTPNQFTNVPYNANQ